MHNLKEWNMKYNNWIIKISIKINKIKSYYFYTDVNTTCNKIFDIKFSIDVNEELVLSLSR